MTTMAPFDVKSLYSDYVKNMETYIMFRIAQRVVELTPSLTEKGRAPIKMSIGAPTQPPPKALLDYFKKVLDEPGIHTYSVPKGEQYFRDAVSERMKKRFGVDVDPNTEVCSLIGSKEGLAVAFRTLITPSLNREEQDIILTPDPGYASYKDAIEVGAGGLCYPVPLTPDNKYMPDFNDVLANLKKDGLDPKKVKALILNYPSNPIGAPCPLSYYEDVVKFARENGILVISDVAYSEMVYTGEPKPHSVLEVEGAKDLTIEFHSMSKPYAMTGWRIAFAVGNADAVGIVAKLKGTSDSGIFKAIQKASAFALTSPECDEYIVEVNKIYEAKQKLMLDGFKSLGWPMDEIKPPRATFYFWLPIPPRYKTSVEFANDMLEKAGIVVVPGVAFGDQGEGFFRMSLVNPDEELNAVISRMKEDGFTYE